MNSVCKDFRNTFIKDNTKEKIIQQYGYIRLFVKTKQFKLSMQRQPVKEFRNSYCNKINYDTDYMRLMIPKKTGDLDDIKTLNDYKILDNSILHGLPTLSKRQVS